jgi:hypothetical protein
MCCRHLKKDRCHKIPITVPEINRHKAEMKDPYEKGIAIRSASSLALGIVRYAAKRENRETSEKPAKNVGRRTAGEGSGCTARMHVSEESDSGILPMNHSNKDGKPSAESEEGRLLIKENSLPSSTYPTQSGSARVPRVESVRTRSMLGRYSSAIRAACANERSCGSVRGAISNGVVPTATSRTGSACKRLIATSVSKMQAPSRATRTCWYSTRRCHPSRWSRNQCLAPYLDRMLAWGSNCPVLPVNQTS